MVSESLRKDFCERLFKVQSELDKTKNTLQYRENYHELKKTQLQFL